MEALQVGYLRAVCAAAGCNIVGQPEIDEGIDIVISHKSESHLKGEAWLALQLKATEKYAGTSPRNFSAQMRQDRYDEFRATDPAMQRIVVVMNLPKGQEHWVRANHRNLRVRHAAYWVNLAGSPPSTVARPTVAAPRAQIFDDVALCGIMARIGQGLAP